MALPPHRQLIWLLTAAQGLLDDALAVEDTLNVMPHAERGALREMADELQEVRDRLARIPHLGPLTESEWGEGDPEGP